MIDVETSGSPGWWLARLHLELYGRRPAPARRYGYAPAAYPNESRADRLERLWAYFVGNPPLPVGAENAKPLFESVIRKARANYAAVVVEAVLNKMRFLGIRSAADGDVAGDDLAREIAKANEFKILTQDVHSWMLAMGDGYVIVGPAERDDESPLPVVTAEDPRRFVTAHDPARPAKVIAAMKVYRDDDQARDYAHVFTPGRCDVFFREGGPSISGRIQARSWFLDEAGSGTYVQEAAQNLIPVTRFHNRYGMGEFESNTDVLDRINDTILRRMVIVTLQAFRQRAIMADLPDKDPDTGELIDYDKIFSADPGALWRLPETAKLWESGQADITPILTSVRDDVKELASCTATPLHMFNPESAQGSAEGASLAREGGTNKAEDRRDRADPRWLRVHRHMFLFSDEPARAGQAMSTMWAPMERFSLADRGSAAAQAVTSLPVETIWTDIWQVEPERIPELHRQRADDLLMAQANAPVPVPAPVPAGG